MSKGDVDERKPEKWGYYFTLLGDGQLCVCPLASVNKKTAVYLLDSKLPLMKMKT